MNNNPMLSEKAVITRLVAHIKDMTHEDRIQLLQYIEERGFREKRKYPRHDCDLSVCFDISDQSYDGAIRNISVEGVFIQTSKKFNIGDSLKMTFTLPNETYPLIASGWVARLTKYGIGVQFDTSDYETEFISSLLLLNAKEYFMAFGNRQDMDDEF